MPVSGLSLITGPQDPSQLNNLLNTIIGAANGAITGSAPTGALISSGTTASALPTFGVVTLASTNATAAYTLPGPTNAQIGQTVSLVSISTRAQTVAGKFNNGNTKLTFKTTRGAAGVEAWQAATLTALSTVLGWAITGSVGTIRSS